MISRWRHPQISMLPYSGPQLSDHRLTLDCGDALEPTEARDGMDSVNSALKELIDFGYVELKKQQRSEDGKFSGNAYGFHAKPIKNDADDNRTGFSVTVKPSTDKPCMENPVLLNTNKLNIDLKKTEQTNLSDSRAEDCKVKEDYGQEVSESVL